MAEFDYFVTADEYAELLEAAFADGFRLCLNKNFPGPQGEYVTEKEAIRGLLKSGQRAFLLERDDFSRYPIKLRPVTREGVELWYPRAKEGGPAIETYFWEPYSKDGSRFIACSLFTYHAKIENPTTGGPEPAGDAVKAAYRQLIALLRKRSRRTQSKSKKRSAYVSPGTEAMLAEGWKLAPPFESQPP